MKYTIEITDYDGDKFTMMADSEKEAIELAEYESGNLDNEIIIISSYRKSDGQTIYLNRDGYSPIGINWR